MVAPAVVAEPFIRGQSRPGQDRFRFIGQDGGFSRCCGESLQDGLAVLFQPVRLGQQKHQARQGIEIVALQRATARQCRQRQFDPLDDRRDRGIDQRPALQLVQDGLNRAQHPSAHLIAPVQGLAPEGLSLLRDRQQ